MGNKKAFAQYIRSKRIEAGLTQKSFADQLFVTESAVSKWERGLSYPDITLINDICTILQISERELLTASEDLQARNQEKLAQKYMTMVRRFKVGQMLIYGIALLTCFICNLAVQHTLSWFFIVLAAEMVAASLTLLPVLVQKKRGLITLASFTLSLMILLLVCCIYTNGNWFFIAAISVLFGMCVVFLPFVLKNIWLPSPLANHKTLLCFAVDTILLFVLLLMADLYVQGGWFWPFACPIAAFCLILPWGMMLILRYAKMNNFFKTAGCLGLTTAFFYFLNGILNMILENIPFRFELKFDFRNWSQAMINNNVNAIIFFSLLGLSIIFVIVGIVYELRRPRKQPTHN
jgi:transcriptional regulator with XRE-family HTH domain